mmetsp:Transcript_15802/g.43706  ORF Transcript_15802/g.43706 Transcript_15802/m.43706 type:complete len:203 (-) Transcript_15802:513-1121(-)
MRIAFDRRKVGIRVTVAAAAAAAFAVSWDGSEQTTNGKIHDKKVLLVKFVLAARTTCSVNIDFPKLKIYDHWIVVDDPCRDLRWCPDHLVRKKPAVGSGNITVGVVRMQRICLEGLLIIVCCPVCPASDSGVSSSIAQGRSGTQFYDVDFTRCWPRHLIEITAERPEGGPQSLDHVWKLNSGLDGRILEQNLVFGVDSPRSK